MNCAPRKKLPSAEQNKSRRYTPITGEYLLLFFYIFQFIPYLRPPRLPPPEGEDEERLLEVELLRLTLLLLLLLRLALLLLLIEEDDEPEKRLLEEGVLVMVRGAELVLRL